MAYVHPAEALETTLSEFIKIDADAHKGDYGRLLVLGGSKLFHAPMIWSAGSASRIVDIVHVSSTSENNEVFTQLKSKFVDGIVVQRSEILNYVDEDDCILIGPGMPRGDISDKVKENEDMAFNEIVYLEQEHDLTYALVRHLIKNFPRKKFIFDAGALQNMDKEWLLKLENPPIITPHTREFDRLFGIDLTSKNLEERVEILKQTAQKYKCVILLKNVTDYITDGVKHAIVEGGNAGLAKGGSGDILSGIAGAFYTKNSAFNSCLLASYILNETAEMLYEESGLMYNSTDVMMHFAKVAHRILG